MTRINLLPWRDELRKQNQQEFIISIVFVAVAAIAILFGMQAYLDSLIVEQQDKKRIVNAKVAEVNLITAKIKDIETQNTILQSKRSAIQALQKSRPEIVHFIDAIARVTPEGVYLTQLKQDNARVALIGKTQSNARVSAFMRNVEANQWLVDPELNIIRGSNKNKNGKLSDFTLYAQQWKSEAEDEEL
ncbi:PilN domain-containing protein [Methyloprofundus sp.]|uniref:PilN domain-containing protein n=1 Tax=Methyloprofundus sp. TaxID=2020875 RepID=UPI003D10C1ED